jgi:hypothetical protein
MEPAKAQTTTAARRANNARSKTQIDGLVTLTYSLSCSGEDILSSELLRKILFSMINLLPVVDVVTSSTNSHICPFTGRKKNGLIWGNRLMNP